MTTRLPVLAAAALIFIGACSDSRTPTSPPPGLSPGGDPSKSISDGFHSGNPNFFFLVPTLPPTSSGSSFKLGTFNPNLQPEVLICQLATTTTYPLPTDACVSGGPVADLKSPGSVHVVITPATSFETSLKTTYSLPADGFYYAIWNTSSAALTPNKFYRISVQTGAGQLGFVDIVPEPTGTGLFQLLNAVTHQVVPTLQNGTIPIVFRIQNGATCWPATSCVEATVTNTGSDLVGGVQGTLVTAPSGNNDGKDGAKAFFPNGFLNGVKDGSGKAITSIVVTIKQVTPTVGQNCQNPIANPQLLQFLTCYNFSVSPMPVNQWGGDVPTPVTVSTCPFLPNTSPLGEVTQLWASDNGGQARPLPPSIMPLNCGSGTFDTPRIGMLRHSDPVLGLTIDALGAVGNAMLRVFGPKTAYAWDVGVGGLDAGPGLSIINWDAAPQLAMQAAPSAAATSVIAVSATATTDHDIGSEGEHIAPMPGLPVYFSVAGGTLSATASGIGSAGPITATTDVNGVATVYLTVGSGTNTVTATVKDAAATNVVTTGVATITGTSVAAGGNDLVLFGDANMFDDTGGSDVNNQQLFKNLVSYTTSAARSGATNVLVYCGHGTLHAYCAPAATFQATLQAIGYSVQTDLSATLTTPIADNTKVVILVTPTVGFSQSELDALQLFANQGGRIVLVGEYPSNYGDAGLGAFNSVLVGFGYPALPSGSSNIACSTSGDPRVVLTNIAANPITAGMQQVTVECGMPVSLGQAGSNLFFFGFSDASIPMGVVGPVPIIPE